jgi:hypothetical protein
VWDIVRGAPMGGCDGAGIRRGQRDHGGREDWGRRKRDKVRSLGGGGIYFESSSSRDGRKGV